MFIFYRRRPAPIFEELVYQVLTTRARQTRRTLALDPWTGAIGFAMLEDGRLIRCGVRYLAGMPLAERLRLKGLSFVRELIEFYRPDTVVLSITDYPGSKRSEHVRSFCRLLKKLIHAEGLEFAEYDPYQVKSFLVPGYRLNKHGIALSVARRFPELAAYVPPPRKAWQPQDLRMSAFHAVALALASSATTSSPHAPFGMAVI